MINEAAAAGDEPDRTEQGKPAAALIPYEEHRGFVETLNILSDPAAMAALEEAESDIEAGRLVDLP